MIKKLKLLFFSFVIFFITNLAFAQTDEDIYQKIDLFSEVLDKINKEYVEEEHYAKVLGGKKHARYDLYIHWLEEPKYGKSRPSPDKLQCWEVKLLSNG